MDTGFPLLAFIQILLLDCCNKMGLFSEMTFEHEIVTEWGELGN